MMSAVLEHPSRERLAAFDAGRLEEADSDAIERHLAECAECCQTLKQLPSVDGYVALLRAAANRDEATVLVWPTLGNSSAQTQGAESHDHVDDTALGEQPQRFGNYELLSEIARGGMGVVYKARQIGLNRIVALKMILAGQLASAEEVRRFHAEANAAAHLDHPGIVPIYEVGEQNGQHFFTMALVKGSNLAERLRQGPMPPREVASLVRSIAVAVQHAHDKGVIHRDLKPANVLLAEDEGRDSQLVPKITDFGLAKLAQSDTHLTGTGQVVGTPSYMPPEQAAGRTREIRETADVYSIGAILYACLTGRPPHQAATAMETVMQVLDAEPAPPRLLNPQVPRALEAICLKCLHKEPARRYGTAQQLADELQRFLEGEPTQATSVNLLDYMLHALRKDRHEENFQNWGLGLMAFGAVIAAAHAAMFALEMADHEPLIAFWLPRGLMLVVILLLLRRFRPHSMLPTNSAERLVWGVWVGYLICVGVVGVTLSASGLDSRLQYAFSATLSALGFFVMGVHVWGRAYVIGIVFLLAAPLLGSTLKFASLEYGILWGISCLIFGGHYWRLAHSAVSNPNSGVGRVIETHHDCK
jgi:tRNA A-37 threonylcarbamoyl transferase component Bud32